VPRHAWHIKLNGVANVYGAIVALCMTTFVVVSRCPDEAAGDSSGDGAGGGQPCLSEPPLAIPAATPDGVADMALVIEAVASEAPIELVAGATIQIQGSYFAASQCGDDGVPCPDSFVVRDELGRLIVAMLQRSGPSPIPGRAVFEELGVTPATWMAPLELRVVDDESCPTAIGPCGGAKIRLGLELGVGACEPTLLTDESTGHLAERFFISVNDLERWEPSFYCVDEIDTAQIYVARQACVEPGDCPTRAHAECGADDVWGQDRAYLRFAGYGSAPTSVAYTYQCLIVGVRTDAKAESPQATHTYELDCGAL
jgi:hypothetical protein